MQRHLHNYVALITLAAAASATAVFVLASGKVTPNYSAAFFLAALGVLPELVTYKMARGATGSVAIIPFLAAVLVAPEWTTVAAVSAAITAVSIVRRRDAVKTVFNTAQATLSVSVGVLAYRAAGGVSVIGSADLASFAATHVVAVLALLFAFVIANSASVNGVIAITEGTNFWVVVRDNTLATAVYTICSGAIAYGLAAVFVRWGMVGAGMMALPFIAVRQFYATSLQLQQTNRELLELMVKAIEARDPYTSGHSRRVADSATIIARGLGLSSRQVDRVRIAALLHDLGKIDEIYAPILRKEGRLTAEEWKIMKTHPIKSAELVATLSDLKDVVKPVRHHHEHWDGKGYPDGLAGEDIPLGARIITFADTIDALTTDRPYRRALGEVEVRAEFVKHCGTQFDPTICGHVLSPAVWSELFPGTGGAVAQREVTRTPQSRPAIAAM
jgi:hypothetical protein